MAQTHSSAASYNRYDALLFSAAGAFVSLPRPGRDDAQRLDQLALPLLAHASQEGKRRLAAVLSEARSIIPEALVKALAMEPIEIAASLLISRAEIPEHILLDVIALRGEDHARVIKLRTAIGETTSRRIDELVQSIVPVAHVKATLPLQHAATQKPAVEDMPAAPASKPLNAPDTRDALRRLMMQQTLRPDIASRMVVEAQGDANLVARLINLSLTSDPDMLATAIADALQLPFAAVRRLVRRRELHSVIMLLKGLELGATDSFAIIAALRPLAFGSQKAIAGFYLAFQATTQAATTQFLHDLQKQENGSTRRQAG
jgi:uncharacterized protein (DUF2336 family)